MDMLFSPYGVGGLPKSAMAEIERRTEELLKSSSLHRMLELEKKHKVRAHRLCPHRLPAWFRVLLATCLITTRVSDIVCSYAQQMERLRGVQQLLPPPSQSPSELKDGPPPRPARPDALSPEQNYLMLKIARRNVILPSLSITIPQPANDAGGDPSSEVEAEHGSEKYADARTPTNSETFHKQVKFLAPEDNEGDDPNDDAMSEQSSICQSPSWEGYGQRKKEKKLEAERRKKEKEQAEKEAKANRKRNAARLSKPPPPPSQPVTTSRDARAGGLVYADRSMSDPLLISQHLLQDSQSIDRPKDAGRATSTDDLIYDNAVVTRQDLQSSKSDEPTPSHQPSSPAFASKPERRSPRDICPPSASRTPMLRHMSPSSRDRANNLLPQGTHRTASGHDERIHADTQSSTGLSRSQASLTIPPTMDGGPREGYVRYQRAQSTERAMAGLRDEQLFGSANPSYHPTRTNSHQEAHTRRPSLTQEAKSAALKLVGARGTSTGREDGPKDNRPGSQNDYFTFKAIPYSPSVTETVVSAGSMSTSTMNHGGTRQRPCADERPPNADAAASPTTRAADGNSTMTERPSTSQSSVGSRDPSIAGSVPSSHSKKGRSLRDAAKAALSISKAAQRHQDGEKPSVPVPPYFALRARMHSRHSTRAENDTSSVVPAPASDVALVHSQGVFMFSRTGETNTPQRVTVASPVSDPGKLTDVGAQEGSRASEASSSSSAFEDGSPLPSPTTTPDTSRPQSAKDIPLGASEFVKEGSDHVALQDDERTLRQSIDSSKSSTPRLADSEVRENMEMAHEDRWSRTALPIDIDGDAESPTATAWNHDNRDGPNQELPDYPQDSNATTEHPAVRSAISIPPRSKKRDQATVNSPTRIPVETRPSNEETGQDTRRAPRKLKVVGGEQRMTEGSSRRPRVDEDVRAVDGPPDSTPFGDFTTYPEPADNNRMDVPMDNQKRKHHQRHARPRAPESEADSKRTKEDEAQLAGLRRDTNQAVPGQLYRNWTSGSISSTSSTAPSSSPRSLGGSPALPAGFQIPSNPYFTDLPSPVKDPGVPHDTPRSVGSPSPISLPSPVDETASRPPTQPRVQSLPARPSASATSPRAAAPAGRPAVTPPVSILKQPKNPTPDPPSAAPATARPPVLSALPKHMQLQAGISVRPPATAAETRMAPIAKMFVECCNCKFYHDMPSKIYECMAKPDAVVEDRTLGISGAITTMVKCPWCQHNMSRNCCAGYAAVVYLKEKLH